MEFPRRSLLQELQRNCVLLSQVLIENTVPVDVASLLEVNHVNIVLCVDVHVIASILLYISIAWMFLSVYEFTHTFFQFSTS